MSKRVWLITGCSKGFGRALAEALIADGEILVATARNVNAIYALEAAGTSGQVLVQQLDVTDRRSIDEAVRAAVDAFGRIDVLVNNAGYGIFGSLEEVSQEQTDAIFATNVFGVMNVLRAVMPIMRAQRAGRILNVASNGGRFALPCMGVYHATKYAVEGFSESLAQEAAPLGIKLTIIEPGGFSTDFNTVSLETGTLREEYQPARDIMNAFAADYQLGDPLHAARAMMTIARMEEPPLRVALGPTAQKEILDRLTTDIECYRTHENIWIEAAAG